MGFEEVTEDNPTLGDHKNVPLPTTERFALPPIQMEVSSETMGSSWYTGKVT